MAQIVSLLNGENINQDHQITALHKALINPWVISGLAVTAGQVAVGEAFVECTRSNGEKIMVHFQNTSVLNIDTSGNKKIFVEIKQANIDNGIINTEDGSNIGEIKWAANYPTKNYISLASVTGGTITDDRKFMGRKIPDVRGQNRKPSDYNSKTFYGPEFVEWTTLGITGVHWLNLHTYCSWNNNQPQYTTQMAITSSWQLGIWMRKANDANTWNAWQKVYPVTASAIDIASLEEETNSNINAYTMIQTDSGIKKAPISSILQNVAMNFWWEIRKFSNANINENWDDVSLSINIPKGGFFTIAPGSSIDGWTTTIQHSTDNRTWTNVVSTRNMYTGYQQLTIAWFIKPWYARIKNWRITRNSETAYIQIFQ